MVSRHNGARVEFSFDTPRGQNTAATMNPGFAYVAVAWLPTTLVHNAVGGAFGSFLEIDPAVLNRNFQVNTMGLCTLSIV
jgi:hypothetical protein